MIDRYGAATAGLAALTCIGVLDLLKVVLS